MKQCKVCKKDLQFEFQEICWDCERTKDIQDVSAYAVANGETCYVKYIVCPYCGYNYGEDEMHESQDCVCYNCEKKFRVEVDYDISFSTTKIEVKE